MQPHRRSLPIVFSLALVASLSLSFTGCFDVVEHWLFEANDRFGDDRRARNDNWKFASFGAEYERGGVAIAGEFLEPPDLLPRHSIVAQSGALGPYSHGVSARQDWWFNIISLNASFDAIVGAQGGTKFEVTAFKCLQADIFLNGRCPKISRGKHVFKSVIDFTLLPSNQFWYQGLPRLNFSVAERQGSTVFFRFRNLTETPVAYGYSIVERLD